MFVKGLGPQIRRFGLAAAPGEMRERGGHSLATARGAPKVQPAVTFRIAEGKFAQRVALDLRAGNPTQYRTMIPRSSGLAARNSWADSESSSRKSSGQSSEEFPWRANKSARRIAGVSRGAQPR